MVKKYEFIFIVLTYITSADLNEFLNSVSKSFKTYKVIIVNSYYDDDTMQSIKKIADYNDCDFINIENKGYSYGNNRGISYANQHYMYDFLIVSNPDVIVKANNLDYGKFKKFPVIIAPEIKTKTGKDQNPYWSGKCNIAEFLIYLGYKLKNRIILFSGIGINKIRRELFLKCNTKNRRVIQVYAAHGCFTIFTHEAINKLGNVYDENMFLFSEEAMLAHKLEAKGIPVYFTHDIKIFHKEDGSINVAKINEQSIARKSAIYYYERYAKK